MGNKVSRLQTRIYKSETKFINENYGLRVLIRVNGLVIGIFNQTAIDQVSLQNLFMWKMIK